MCPTSLSSTLVFRDLPLSSTLVCRDLPPKFPGDVDVVLLQVFPVKMNRKYTGENVGFIMDLFALGTTATIEVSIGVLLVCQINKPQTNFTFLFKWHACRSIILFHDQIVLIIAIRTGKVVA